MWMVEKDEWTGRAGSDCLLEVSWDGRVNGSGADVRSVTVCCQTSQGLVSHMLHFCRFAKKRTLSDEKEFSQSQR
jgi:hypothetical protein